MGIEIISIIVTDRNEGTVISVDSVTTSRDDISRDKKVAQMEDLFVKKGTANGVDKKEAEDCIDDGYMEIGESEMVSLVWS